MCELGLQELDTLAPGLLTFQEWHLSGPTQGAVRSRMGYADVVHRGAPLYGAGQLLRRFVEGSATLRLLRRSQRLAATLHVFHGHGRTSKLRRLKLALSSAPLLRTFDLARCAVLITDASNVAVAVILTQADDEGRQHPASVAYQRSKLMAAELNYPAHVLKLLVEWFIRYWSPGICCYLLRGWAAGPKGLQTDFALRTDNQSHQTITWLKTNQHLNKISFADSMRSRTSAYTSSQLEQSD